MSLMGGLYARRAVVDEMKHSNSCPYYPSAQHVDVLQAPRPVSDRQWAMGKTAASSRETAAARRHARAK
jgi:hypothetical protein